MTALYIVIGVVVVVTLVAALLLTTRSRRASGPPSVGPQAGATTIEKPPPQVAKGKPPTKAPVPQIEPQLEPDPALEPELEPEPDIALEPEPALEVEAPTYRSRLGTVRGLFSGAVSALRSGKIDAETWDSLEEALIRADVGVQTTNALLADLRARVAAKEIASGTDLLSALGDAIRALLDVPESRLLRFDGTPGTVDVWLVVGVNGVGKTTTIGKLARQESLVGRSILLAAGDTFRAAAADQLGMWAERSGVDIVRGAEGGDPSAIVFDAVQRAAARGNDLVLADTAGRLHNKVNLVEELKKIRRIADRDPGNVTEVLLVLDSTTGQNALIQAKQFTEAVEVTGIVLTKLDGTAKGGIVVAVQRELGIPVKLVGLGEGPDDLVAFDPDAFVDALLGLD
jgi:fused signal recognition particle receptor